MTGSFPHGYALLIGVGQCTNPKWSLPVTVKDMQALRSVLIDQSMCGYLDDDAHIRLLHDSGATRQAIMDGLKWLAEQTAADEKATAVVFYSGHGGMKESTDSYFLLPSNADPKDIESTTLDEKTFTKALRSVKAKRLLVFLDCCHAGGMATAKDGLCASLLPGYSLQSATKGLIDELKRGEGRAVFSSSKNDQKSLIRRDGVMSIYTYHLIEALYGAGNHPQDTQVCLSNLMGHLGKSVPQSAKMNGVWSRIPFSTLQQRNFLWLCFAEERGFPKRVLCTNRPPGELKISFL
jgi:uncharacterized caspase-like protein